MAEQWIELITPTLGLDPYVLIEAEIDGPEEDPNISFRVRAGGGIATPEEIKEFLELVLEGYGEDGNIEVVGGNDGN